MVDSLVKCSGGSDAGASAVGVGGNPGIVGYQFSWSGGIYGNNFSTANAIFGVPADTYSVTVTDANGCTDTTTVTITEPPVLVATGVATDVSCNGGSDGSIDISVTGGIQPYSYSWSNGAPTQDLTGLTSGTYSLVVTDNNGCTAGTSVNVLEPSVLSGTLTSTAVTSFGANDGTATIAPSGGTAGYTYVWDAAAGGQTTQTATGLSAGTYNVTITDANGCTFTPAMGVTVVQPAPALTLPYAENFENGDGGWTASGSNSTWELGTPSGSVISSAGEGIQSWATNLDGQYNDNERSQVVSPVFDFSGNPTDDPVLTMQVYWNTEFAWDGAAVQSSVDGGSTWQLVGDVGNGTNWYNRSSLSGTNVVGGQEKSWTGTGSNGSGGWVVAENTLTGLAGESAVQLRVAFGSDSSNTKEGFAFDNVQLSSPTPPTAPTADSFAANNDGPYVGQHYAFATADFSYMDVNGDPIDHVLIEVLPTSGTLFVDADDDDTLDAGEEVAINDQISKADLDAGNLQYFSSAAANTSFQFEVSDGSLTSAADYIATLNVTVFTEANFAINPASGCSTPHTVFFTDQSTMPDTWAWDFGDGGTSTAQNPVHSYTGTGEFTVTLTVTDTVRNIVSTTTGLVRVSSAISVATSSTDVTTFNGADGTATATPSGGLPPYTYNWSTGDMTASITGLSPGTYTVDVTDDNGCNAGQESVTINNALDTTAPTITCPADINSNTLQVTYTVPTYTDNGFVTSAPAGFSKLGTHDGHTYYISDVAVLPSVAFAEAISENSYITPICEGPVGDDPSIQA